MSATGRGGPDGSGYERHPDDYYKTPVWATKAILGVLPTFLQRGFGILLDPCCGDGAILDAAVDKGWNVRGLELDRERSTIAANTHTGGRVQMRDALAPAPWPTAGLILMNPPFGLAIEFVSRAIKEAGAHGGAVGALLRIPFLASKGRAAFHREYPSDVFVLDRRPEFIASLTCKGTEKGGPKRGCGWHLQQALELPRPKACPTCGGKVNVTTTDNTDYAWFVWGLPGGGGHWSILNT